MSGAFEFDALRYLRAGFAPIPLVPRKSTPALQGWARAADGVSEAELAAWTERLKAFRCGLGLVLGSRHGAWRLAVVAVYAEELLPAVVAALGEAPCAVQGPKGLTIFALAEPEQTGGRFRRRELDGRRRGKAVVELLARGAYVVIPPTQNPTGPPYAWVGQPLLEVGADALPRVTAATLDEIQAAVDGVDEPFRVLNALDANGDEACRAAAEALLARGWPDDAIVSRVRRAHEEARRRAGRTAEDPSADAALMQSWIDRTRRARARPDEVTKRWLEARAEVPRTAEERRRWWTRSSEAYDDCSAWAEREGYPVPHEVVWGTALTRLGIKSAVRKPGGRSTRTRNLRLKPQPEPSP